MSYKLYIDVYFLVNFFMDLLLVTVTGKILRYTATYLNYCISAAAGALWACLSVTVFRKYTVFNGICTYLVISTLMIIICRRDCHVKETIKGVIVLYAVSSFLGGLCHMIYYYTKIGFIINSILVNNGIIILAVMLSLIFYKAIKKMCDVKRRYGENLYTVVIGLQGETVRFRALLDTGNSLRDTFYKRAVHIAEAGKLIDVLNKIDDFTKVKYHVIPYNSLGNSNGIIPVICVDYLYILDGKRVVSKEEKSFIGLYSKKLSCEGVYNMLLNGESLKAEAKGEGEGEIYGHQSSGCKQISI